MDPLRESESQFLRNFGAAANHLGLGGSGLHGYGQPPSSYGLPGLPPDRYRDGLSMPPHLGHPSMAGSYSLQQGKEEIFRERENVFGRQAVSPAGRPYRTSYIVLLIYRTSSVSLIRMTS
jgi:hypothetical protein